MNISVARLNVRIITKSFDEKQQKFNTVNRHRTAQNTSTISN